MKYLIDTSAWIEYLEGSEKGQKVNEILKEEKNEIYSIPLIVAEIVSKVKRKKGNSDSAFTIVTKTARMVELDVLTAKEAGLLHAKEKEKSQSFSLADAIIIKVAQRNNLKIITKDTHFLSFKEAAVL